MTQRDSIDELFAENPLDAAWQAFRSQMASALLLDWLLSDMESRNPDYFSDLESRFQTGLYYEEIMRREGDFDGWVPVHAPDDDIDFWIRVEDLRAMLARLFPREAKDVPSFGAGRQLVVVMFYSALENLARAHGLWGEASRTSVGAALAERYRWARKNEELLAALVDLRETRNLIAHNAAAVTERYVRLVSRADVEIGDIRVVSSADIARFSRAVDTAAHIIRSSK